MTKKRSLFPHSLVLIFAMIIVAQMMTYVVTPGEYDVVYDETVVEPGTPVSPPGGRVSTVRVEPDGRTVVSTPHYKGKVIPGTWKPVEAEPLEPWSFLTLLPQGLEKGGEIIFFVFLVGGVIAVIRATGAIDAMIGSSIRALGKNPTWLVAGMVAIFAVGSSTIGMAEEYMPFIPILVTMCLAMRMDAIVAMGIVYLAAGIGYGCAALNPFTVVVAQKIAGVDPTSGQGFRWCLLAICLPITVHHIMRYARKIKDDPKLSLVADVDYSQGYDMPDDTRLTPPRIAVLGIFVAGLVAIVIGLKYYDWYFHEMMAVFLAAAILSAAVGKLTPNQTANQFCRGAAEMTTTALLIGFARTIEVVLTEGKVIHTVVDGLAGALKGWPAELAAIGMFFVQSICNFFIPSGSGQAYVTMPIMSPLADQLDGVSQQVAVLAYQMGDGFTNMIVPTNALLMGMLVLARVPYSKWLKFVIPFLIKIYIVCAIALVVAVMIGYGAEPIE